MLQTLSHQTGLKSTKKLRIDIGTKVPGKSGTTTPFGIAKAAVPAVQGWETEQKAAFWKLKKEVKEFMNLLWLRSEERKSMDCQGKRGSRRNQWTFT